MSRRLISVTYSTVRFLGYPGFVPVAAPEEFAVVGPVPVAAEQDVEPFNDEVGANANGGHQARALTHGDAQPNAYDLIGSCVC